LVANPITTLYKNEIFIKSCSQRTHQKLPKAKLHNRSYNSSRCIRARKAQAVVITAIM